MLDAAHARARGYTFTVNFEEAAVSDVYALVFRVNNGNEHWKTALC